MTLRDFYTYITETISNIWNYIAGLFSPNYLAQHKDKMQLVLKDIPTHAKKVDRSVAVLFDLQTRTPEDRARYKEYQTKMDKVQAILQQIRSAQRFIGKKRPEVAKKAKELATAIAANYRRLLVELKTITPWSIAKFLDRSVKTTKRLSNEATIITKKLSDKVAPHVENAVQWPVAGLALPIMYLSGPADRDNGMSRYYNNHYATMLSSSIIRLGGLFYIFFATWEYDKTQNSHTFNATNNANNVDNSYIISQMIQDGSSFILNALLAATASWAIVRQTALTVRDNIHDKLPQGHALVASIERQQVLAELTPSSTVSTTLTDAEITQIMEQLQQRKITADNPNFPYYKVVAMRNAESRKSSVILTDQEVAVVMAQLQQNNITDKTPNYASLRVAAIRDAERHKVNQDQQTLEPVRREIKVDYAPPKVTA